MRYPTAEHLAADACVAPITVESGRKKLTGFRRGCDHRFRDATSTLAPTSGTTGHTETSPTDDPAETTPIRSESSGAPGPASSVAARKAASSTTPTTTTPSSENFLILKRLNQDVHTCSPSSQ